MSVVVKKGEGTEKEIMRRGGLMENVVVAEEDVYIGEGS